MWQAADLTAADARAGMRLVLTARHREEQLYA
jgi:hypothetical protein